MPSLLLRLDSFSPGCWFQPCSVWLRGALFPSRLEGSLQGQSHRALPRRQAQQSSAMRVTGMSRRRRRAQCGVEAFHASVRASSPLSGRGERLGRELMPGRLWKIVLPQRGRQQGGGSGFVDERAVFPESSTCCSPAAPDSTSRLSCGSARPSKLSIVAWIATGQWRRPNRGASGTQTTRRTGERRLVRRSDRCGQRVGPRGALRCTVTVGHGRPQAWRTSTRW